MVVVPSRGDPADDPDLRGVAWPDPAVPLTFATKMKADPRYQLIVLIKDDRVVADALYYTFWSDLTLLSQSGGFAPESAIFTAVVKSGTYVLSPVAPPYPPVCGEEASP